MLTLPAGYTVASVTYNGRSVFGAIDIEAPESTVSFVVTSRPSVLTGTVRDSDQRPVPGASVILLPELLPDEMEKLNAFSFQSRDSDGNGLFHFGGLAPGRYRAIATRRRDRDLDFLRDGMRVAETVDLEFGQTATLDLQIK